MCMYRLKSKYASCLLLIQQFYRNDCYTELIQSSYRKYGIGKAMNIINSNARNIEKEKDTWTGEFIRVH